MATTLNLGEGQETTVDATVLAQHQTETSSLYIPRKYRRYNKPQSQPAQPQIPQYHHSHPTNYPIPPTVLPSQSSSSSHHRHIRHPSESSSVNDTSNMVWEQARLSSSTSEPIFPPQMTHTHCGKSLGDQMFSMVPGVSPPFVTTLPEDINPTTITYGRSNSVPLFAPQYNMQVAPGYSPEQLEFESLMHQQMGDVSPNYFMQTSQWTPPLSQLHVGDEFYGQSMMDGSVMGPGTPPGSVYETGTREISLMTQSYHPADQSYSEENMPSYAEMIYMALMSAPNHQMHLQDIYQWFRDTYPKFRHDQTKGWMNSIRHNLSMNGAFVKVERQNGESGKGFMWLLAPAAVEGGIKSTTRYRKQGKAGERVTLTPDASYSCYVTPKRNRAGKRIQTKARRSRTAINKLQHRQHIDQQPKQQLESTSFSEFDSASSMVHTPVSSDGNPLTPDVSSRSSEGFSETLSVGSRHATPALRATEWQSPASAHGHASPFCMSDDDGFCAPFEQTQYYPSYDPDFDHHTY
ncbi:uncharacterized protein DFL_005310 [Arthrobotrys flagrans]|uniref:Fork-head domain-containing protein n=1 Tax=Arthrobotrys flagrans TaxID=97331 RepID=A0A437A7A6_ARTFL|nr:hypothetical protein DFL_005310 [Arthrobotrys flagrans]